MSLPQHIVYGEGGTIFIDVDSRPTNAIVSVYTDGGSALVSDASATISSISTTLAAAASRGATSLTLANANAVTAGSVVWIQDDPEPVLVYKITTSSGVVNLRRPLLKDHANNASCEGTHISYSVLAAAANTIFFDGRAKWTIDSKSEYTGLECTKYPLHRRATIQDVFDRQPKLYEILDSEADTERLLDLAHEEVLQRLGTAGRARCFTGSSEFISCTVLAMLMLYYERMASAEGTALYERYKQSLQEELERTSATTPRDTNQDGVAAPQEQMVMRSIPLRRV